MSQPAPLRLQAGALEAVFLPDQGMLCASLRHRGQELLRRLERPHAAAAAGVAIGMPLLHPWANRLAGLAYRAAGRQVEIDPYSPLLHYDANALLLHGVPWSRLRWRVAASTPGRARAQLHWRSPAQRAVFPFEHTLELDVVLGQSSLDVATTLHACAGEAVPVAFGFHPHLGLPDTPRGQWRLSLPAMRRLPLDALGLPCGSSRYFPGEQALLATRALDDHFALDAASATLAIEDHCRRLGVELLEGYSHAQVYAPPGHDYVALEPMTAPVNALDSGQGLRVLAPGQRFQARFRVTVQG